MITYWDLSEKERAALSREDVLRYVDAELMHKGVLKPAPLELVEVPDAAMPTRTVYAIGTSSYDKLDVVFESAEHAGAFLAMKPMEIAFDYGISSDVKFTKPLHKDATVMAMQLPSDGSVVAAKALLKEAHAAKAENGRRQKASEDQQRKVDEALEGLWEDWHACRARAFEMAKVVAVFNDYTRTAGGDVAVAAKFLRKVFTADDIREACAWSGIVVPAVDVDWAPPEPVAETTNNEDLPA